MPENKSRRQKGEVRRLIYEGLLDGSKTFGEIHKYIGKSPSGTCSDKVLYTNLESLKNTGDIETKIIGGKKKWVLANEFWQKRARGAVGEIVEDNLPIAFAHPGLSPAFMLASGLSREEIEMGRADESLDNLAKAHFIQEIKNTLFGMGKKREIILGFAARCLQLGASTSLRESEGDQELREVLESLEKLKEEKWGKLEPRDTLENLIRAEAIEHENFDEMLGHYILEGMELALGGKRADGGEIVLGVEIRSIPLPAHMARLFATAFADILSLGVLTPRDQTKIKVRELIKWADFGGVFNIPQAEEFEKKVKTLFDDLKPEIEQATKRWEENIKKELESTSETSLEEWGKGRRKSGELRADIYTKDGTKVCSERLGTDEIRSYHVDIGAVAWDVVKSLPTDLTGNVEWLKKHKHQFLDFLEDVKKTRFSYVVAVGYPNLARWPLEFLIPRRVDEFMEALAYTWATKWMGRTEELFALIKYAEKTICQLEKNPESGLPRIEDKLTAYAFGYAFGPWPSPQVLYKYDPRTRRAEWWQKFKKTLEQALEKGSDEKHIEIAKEFYVKHLPTPPKLPRQVRRAKP